MSTLAMRNFSLLALLPEILGSKTEPQKTDETITFASAVNGISKFDLPYVYHHLYEGRRLSLRIKGDLVSVYYRAHKLGILPFISTKRLLRLLDTGYEVQVKIKKLNRANYLPVDGVQISMKFLMIS